MFIWISVAAVIVAAILIWNLSRRFGTDRIQLLNDQRRATARLVGRGELVDGNRHLDVALAVTRTSFYYENADMAGSLDLSRIREIEYDNELATGTAPRSGEVLRLRSNSQTFEFILPQEKLAEWHSVLPARDTQVMN